MSILITLFLISLIAAIYTHVISKRLNQQHPALGEFIELDGQKIHSLFLPTTSPNARPTLVFIHGASGNLRDQMSVFRPPLEGRENLLFIDRLGHGWSERGGDENNTPDGQADTILKILDHYKIEKAIIIGHSYGGAVTASIAVKYPDRLSGLIFLAPATYPWPGGIAWYYHLAAMPIIGHLFTNIITLPAGLLKLTSGVACVFSPNITPKNYINNSGAALVLRPKNFRYNAIDISQLEKHVEKTWPQYKHIIPTRLIIDL